MNVNLATRPLRNRRAFIGLATFITAGCLVFLAMTAKTFSRFHGKHAAAEASLAKIKASIAKAETEKKEYDRRITIVPSKDKENVKLINDVIYRKSLSWTEFLTKLEESLPPSCYLTSLAPSVRDNVRMEVKLRVVCKSFDELLTFTANLNDKKFGGIKILEQTKDDHDLLLAELVFNYEWHD